MSYDMEICEIVHEADSIIKKEQGCSAIVSLWEVWKLWVYHTSSFRRWDKVSQGGEPGIQIERKFPLEVSIKEVQKVKIGLHETNKTLTRLSVENNI